MHQASPVRGWCGVQDAVEHRVAQVDVARGHVDLGAQHARAVRELAGPHAAEQVEVLLDGAVAERAVPAGLGQRAAVRADLLRRLVVDVGLAGLDQALGPVVELLEVVRGVVEVRRPSRSRASARRAWIASTYSCSSLVGLVSSKRRWQRPPNSCGDAEVEADRLGVADVQVAVRLRREARHDLAVCRRPRDRPGRCRE